MTAAIACPICLTPFAWDGQECWVWRDFEERYENIRLSGLEPTAQEDVRRRGYVRCSNIGDIGRHYLPAPYGDFDRPLVVGLVGKAGAGKTSLLAAMVHEIFSKGMRAFELDVSPLDLRVHQEFRARYREPFVNGHTLEPTKVGSAGYAECLLVSGPTGRRPLVLFDLAGGDFDGNRPDGASTRFLAGADALIFVEALEYRPSDGGAPPDVNAPFTLATRAVQAAPEPRDVAATVAVTKADRFRYNHPVDRWFGRRGPSTVDDLATFTAETEDAYVYLRSRGVDSALTPFDSFNRCTMHFVSAAGHDAFDRTSEPAERPDVSPSGVLRPLIAVLAMTGVLRDEVARQVRA